MIRRNWDDIVDKLDYAFQPIVNMTTGITFGFEALLRNYDKAGFNSIQEVFDTAYSERVLYKMEVQLREKAITKFINIKNYQKYKLFFNIDNRALEMHDYSPGNTLRIMSKYNIPVGNICFELSEKHEFKSFIETKSILNIYKQQIFKIAIDDYGTGISGLELLYHTDPDYIKIDRFFITGIESDVKKKLFVSSIINIAHSLGVLIIAEGVENEKEFYKCREMGCDLVQGYFVQKPSQEVEQLKELYDKIEEMSKKDKRNNAIDREMVLNRLDKINPIRINDGVGEMFEALKKNKERTYLPVVSHIDEPIGIIREVDIKEYVYSPFGKELLKNKMSGEKLINLVFKTSSVEINTRIDKILEIFSSNENDDGIMITENGKYIGFLTAKSLINIISERNIAEARDQNPLTKLKGNSLIGSYIGRALYDINSEYMLLYFDFDNFKPFNDKYGFRQGDRAILLFADILKKFSNTEKSFIGHIGGDDFFMGVNVFGKTEELIKSVKENVIGKFKHDITSLYNEDDRERGYIKASDRNGEKKKFTLMEVSCAVIHLKGGVREVSAEEVSNIMAAVKKKAKTSKDKVAVFEI